MVHLKPEEVVEFWVKRDCAFSQQLRLRLNTQGSGVDDEMMTKMISRRVQMQDCLQNGWFLEGYP